MTIEEDEVLSLVQPHFSRLWRCVSEANAAYLVKYPNRTIHRPATRAAITNDEILARVITEFDEVTDCRFDMDRRRNLRFLVINERILLWFKKVTLFRRPSIYLTAHARRVLSGGQLEMFPRKAVVLVGYLLNREETAIQRLSFSPPFLIKPAWWFDIEDHGMAQAAAMPGPKKVPPRQGTKIVVIRSPKQDKLYGD